MKGAVAFATLFFGLTVGEHPIEVLVGNEVARVEILLDGVAVAILDRPPWKTVCGLGQRLEPKRLEAVAYDAEDEELGRATQWMNVPRPPAQSQLLLDTDPVSGRMIARLRSNSITQEVPQTVTAQLDGRPLTVTDGRRVELPELDPEQLHYLRVDFEFADGLQSTVERTFGGSFADEVAAELTAVPLALEEAAVAPDPRRDGWLEARGEALEVVDVVEGPAEVVVVRDQGAQPDIDRMVRRQMGDLRSVAKLKRGYSLTFLRPVAARIARGDIDVRLFEPSSPLTAHDGGVFWLMTALRAPKVSPRLQRLSDALAVAGLSASASGHRRAVILLLGGEPEDNSQYSAAGVVDYLRTIRVPLVVWSTTGERDTPWGIASDASSMAKIERQTKLLFKAMDRQRIAWVRGVYLPPEISLHPDTLGVRLAGT
jgi:hypothetical protein